MTIADFYWAAGGLGALAILCLLAYLLPDDPIDDPDGDWLPDVLRVLEPVTDDDNTNLYDQEN